MAVNVTTVNPSGVLRRSFDVEATADGDTGATITHGLPGVTPTNTMVIYEPLTAVGAGLSFWHTNTLGATTLTVDKATTAGTGAAGAQVRVHIIQVHSIIE